MSKYLLEIGVEELPYKFVTQGIAQLQKIFEKLLKDNNINFSSISTFGTPRRLVAIIDGLEEKQPTITKTLRGPNKKIAYNPDGSLSKAGEGFLKKQNLTEKDTEIKEENGTEYLFVKIEQKGQDTKELLKEKLPELILSLQGAHFMRWGELDIKFARPIRWIVSLFDNKVLKFSLGNISSSNISRGHRFSKIKECEITTIENYFDILKKSNVIVNQEERKSLIQNLLNDAAKSVDGEIIPDEELLNEITNIVEYPVPVVCTFKKEYLQIPDDVTVTVMKAHQRYFPVYKDGKLSNYFITIANFVGNKFENIKLGNERVVTARLEDGKFFYEEDLKKPLCDRVQDLQGITFQKGLGTMYDKALRMVEISDFIANELNIQYKEDIRRTSLLAKADLLTNLVYEFTELEGFIGANYAEKSGEKENVALGIKEHYFPLGADSATAQGIEGQIAGIADKIDTIVTTFAVGKKPTGSADPLGIRRATIGIIMTILNSNLDINIYNILKKTIELLPIQVEDNEKLFADIEEFFIGRLKIILQNTYKYDLVDAVCATKPPLESILDVKNRLEVLQKLSQNTDFEKFNDAINRIIRITKDCNKTNDIEVGLLNIEAEKNLYNAFEKIPSNLNYEDLALSLQELEPFISKFFEDVLVMDKDEKIKQNRINLLLSIKDYFNKIADFSKIVL